MQYWVVGAMWGGVDDALDMFLKRGYWYCWDPKVGPTTEQTKGCFPKIKEGDRIAVKKMLGQGSPEIEIRAIGVVKEIDLEEWRVYVEWLIEDINRRVPIRNFMGSIHGPYSYENSFVRDIFCV